MTGKAFALRMLTLWGVLLPCSVVLAAWLTLALVFFPPGDVLRDPTVLAILGAWAVALVTGAALSMRWWRDRERWLLEHP
jgi:hypothetical protein